MQQPALRLNDNEILLVSAIATISFTRSGDKALLVLELCNHKTLTFTNREAEQIHEKVTGLLSLV